MKLTAVLLFATCMQVAARTEGQTVTLKVKNAPMKEVFREIQKQTGLNVMVDESILEKARRVTLDVRDMPVPQVLNICLKNEPLTYTIVDGRIVVKPAPTVVFQPTVTTPPLLPPPIDIKGRVVNENGEPVVVSVIVKGTNNGSSSNADGNFELKNVDENATLVISGVSIVSMEVKVNGKENISITVKITATEGEDVVVKTNYWETKQRLNPGNISKVPSKEIEKQPVSNPLAALQANVPGLEITQQNGVPGGGFQVRIRGLNSIANGNNPLIVIDGVPFISTRMSFNETSGNILAGASAESNGYSPLNSINPSDIESIEVLKDADATAIYGSRGANGVILISTKKGRIGKTKVGYNFYSGTGKISRKMDLLHTQEYLQMRREAFKNDNITPTISNARDLLMWDTTRYTNWQKELIGGTANYLDAQLSVSGGEKNTQFLIGGGYHKETTVFPGENADRRISVHANINNISSNNRLRTSLLLNYSSNATTLPSLDLTNLALTLAPNAPALYNTDGNLNWTNWNLDNPIAYTRRLYEQTVNNLISNLSLTYTLLPGLDLKANLGYITSSLDGIQISPISSLSPTTTQINGTRFSRSNLQNWTVEPQISWNKNINKGVVNILAGTTFLEQVNSGLAQFASGFSSEALMKNIAAASVISSNTNYYSQYRYNGFYGRVNYTYDSRYVANLTGRRDGSSRFGPGKQFANFGAVGLAWIFSEEKFIQKALPFLSFGKLRVSYGTSGNDQLGDYQYLDTYSPAGSGTYQTTVGLAPQRLFNPDFGWEENRKFETGLEFGLIDDRVSLGISYYRNRSSSQLVGFPLAPTTGFTSVQSNFPAIVQNSGFEFQLNATIIQRKDISWGFSANLAIPKNKLIEFPNIEAFTAYANSYVVGEPLSILKQYHYQGIDLSTGIYQFEDVNADGAFDVRDRQIVKFRGRRFYGGIQNNMRYKTFQLSFLFQFVGQDGLDYTQLFNYLPGALGNQPTIVINRWQKFGDNENIQRYGTTGAASTAYSRFLGSESSVVDASFIRLKNISLSWTLPQNWTGKSRIDNGQLFIQCQNLFTITKYKGLEPEHQAPALPLLRVITAGFRLTL